MSSTNESSTFINSISKSSASGIWRCSISEMVTTLRNYPKQIPICYTLDETRAQSAPRGINTITEYFTRPDFYSVPRQVLIGVSMDFLNLLRVSNCEK